MSSPAAELSPPPNCAAAACMAAESTRCSWPPRSTRPGLPSACSGSRAEFPENGISAADRRRRLAEIDAELRRLEIDEERLIRSSPMRIIRRGDAHPAVVLEPDLDRLAA